MSLPVRSPFSGFARTALTFASLAVALTACGVPDEDCQQGEELCACTERDACDENLVCASGLCVAVDDDGSPAPSPGQEPAPEPPGGLSCGVAEDCPNWFCECESGPPVNSRRCFNNRCLDAPQTCPSSCEAFGTCWLGIAGGGFDGGSNAGPNACTGTPSPSPSPSPEPGSLRGAHWQRYASDLGKRAHYYGVGATQALAASAAQNQCFSTNFTDAFCSGGTMDFSTERLSTWDCEFAKFASGYGTIRFYGSGRTATEAKASTVQACINSGAWRGWFCGADALTCTEQ